MDLSEGVAGKDIGNRIIERNEIIDHQINRHNAHLYHLTENTVSDAFDAGSAPGSRARRRSCYPDRRPAAAAPCHVELVVLGREERLWVVDNLVRQVLGDGARAQHRHIEQRSLVREA